MWTYTSKTRFTLMFILIAGALIISACKPKFVIGPEQTFAIDVPRPESSNITNVTLDMAVPQGTLAIAGESESLMEGEIIYNAKEYEPQMTNGDDALLISQAEPGPKSVVVNVQNNLINRWDLRLGDALVNFEIRLANGEYTIEIAKSLPADCNMNVNAGVGKVNLIVDPSLGAQVIMGEHTDLLEISARGNWTQTGDVYQTSAGSTALTITVNMSGGELNLNNK